MKGVTYFDNHNPVLNNRASHKDSPDKDHMHHNTRRELTALEEHDLASHIYQEEFGELPSPEELIDYVDGLTLANIAVFDNELTTISYKMQKHTKVIISWIPKPDFISIYIKEEDGKWSTYYESFDHLEGSKSITKRLLNWFRNHLNRA